MVIAKKNSNKNPCPGRYLLITFFDLMKTKEMIIKEKE
jgi:hypothetical protein